MPQVELFERRMTIAAPPAVVFDCFTDPELLVQWLGRSATLDARIGGTYALSMANGDTTRGRYVEVDRPRRLVFTWGWDSGAFGMAPGSSVVEVVLEPDGPGTLLHMLHRGLVSEEAVNAHTAGWTHYLARLAARAEGRDPGPDLWANRPHDAPLPYPTS